MAPTLKSSKVATKGSKQIVEENISTLIFYRNMSIAANALSLILLIFYNSTVSIILYFCSCLIYIGAYQFMAYMARSRHSEAGQLLDSGVDLNMEGGIAEHIKDVIILTAGCQILASLVSTYLWCLWLFAPVRAMWLIWKNILSPYFCQPTPAEPEMSEKKQKKMERRMRRQQ